MPDPSLLLLEHADPLVTMNSERDVLADGWVAARDGMIIALGSGRPPQQIDGIPYEEWPRLDAAGCVVTPGLINTHHHLFQTRTRAHRDAVDAELFDWLHTLYPVWAQLSEDDIYRGAKVGLRELMRSGCTTTADHHYLFPRNLPPNLIDITIEAAAEVGIRFHPTRGSMSRSEKDGGLPPESVVQDPDMILADSERLISQYHDPEPGAMVRIGLAPCSPFSVGAQLMRETASLARKHRVRLHTHLAETRDENHFCQDAYSQRPLDFLESVDWLNGDVWIAHGIYFTPSEVGRLGQAGIGISHCPSSNMRLGSGVCRVRDLREAGCPVSIGVDGSASNDSSNLLAECRQAFLLQRLCHGAQGMTVAEVLEMVTLGGACCLGRDDIGALVPQNCCDLALFDLSDIAYDRVEDRVASLILCDPPPARTVVVGGRVIEP
jgi:8-oxoguanine deaminase